MKLEAGIGRKGARVEMIPLIDCVFILLVFFIYSMLTMTVQRGMVVQLPQATATETSENESIVVTVTETGELQINDRTVTTDELRDVARTVHLASPQSRFVINADRRAEHGWVVRVLDELKTIGVSHVTILSEDRGAS